MRIIDADALIDKTDDRYSMHEIGRRERNDIVNALEYAPTIEPGNVRENRRGQWLHVFDTEEGEYWECSECGAQWLFSEGATPTSEEAHFCPNCGADLRDWEKDE